MELLDEFMPVRQWAAERGIYQESNSKYQFLKLQEEIGELASALLKKDHKAIKDAIGDAVVVLTNLAHMENTTIENCINLAYEEIKNRKGSMENGSFVKI